MFFWLTTRDCKYLQYQYTTLYDINETYARPLTRLYNTHLQGLLTRAITDSRITIYTHHTKSLSCTGVEAYMLKLNAPVPAARFTRKSLPLTPFYDDRKAKHIQIHPKKRQPRHASTLKNDNPDVGHHCRLLHEKPMVLPSSHRNSVHSSMKIVCR